MTTREWLKQRIKKAFENTESTITSVIVLALFGGSATILAVSKKALSVFLQIITIPTPLWATILLVLLGYLYIYLKFRKASVPPPNETSIEYFTVGKQKWEATIYNNRLLSINEKPICMQHDLLFIYTNRFYICPEVENNNCKNVIDAKNHYKVKAIATSYIKKELMTRSGQ